MSTKIVVAFTAPINPTGVTPILTHEQVFKALLHKAEKPQAFVPVIDSCEVVSRAEDGSGLTRKVAFKSTAPGVPAMAPLIEEVKFLGDSNVAFHIPATGFRMQNIISRGPGSETDLYLTFVSESVLQDADDKSPEALKKRKEETYAMMQKVVPGSVNASRELVVKGEI